MAWSAGFSRCACLICLAFISCSDKGSGPNTVPPPVAGMVTLLPGSYISNGVTVTILKPLYVDSFEVTQAQYQQVMDTNPSFYTSVHGYYFKTGERPVELVSWYEALLYCNRRSVLEGFDTCYAYDARCRGCGPVHFRDTLINVRCDFSKNGYRLPTEDEWEYAYRAGSASQFFWGSDSSAAIAGAYAWYIENGHMETHPVGEKAANSLGLQDIAGNVWEWCWDRFTSDRPANRTGYSGPLTGQTRVGRGGSIETSAASLGALYRFDWAPVHVEEFLGIRPVRNAD